MGDSDSSQASVCALGGRGGPAMNTDVSGIGVRISFYLQSTCLAIVSARSRSLEEVTTSLYTLTATNMAIVVTSLILGFDNNPQMSLHDALVVLYLLCLSWTSIFFTMPFYNRYKHGDKMLKLFSVLQSYLIFAFFLTILITAPHFGNSPECNPNAVVVLFRPFNALHAGRIVGWILFGVVFTSYTALITVDYFEKLKRVTKEKAKGTWFARYFDDEEPTSRNSLNPGEVEAGRKSAIVKSSDSNAHKTGGKPKPGPMTELEDIRYEINVHGKLLAALIAILVIVTLTVLNTELLIHDNHFLQTNAAWQFGQVLPMFLLVLPLVTVYRLLKKYGLRRHHHRIKPPNVGLAGKYTDPSTRSEAKDSTQSVLKSAMSLHNGSESHNTAAKSQTFESQETEILATSKDVIIDGSKVT